MLSLMMNFENRDYIISSFHAILTVGLTTNLIIGNINENQYAYYSSISTGYALFDIINLRNPRAKNTFFLTIHHFIIIFCNLWININPDPYVIKMVSYNYLTEASTPFLNLSMFLYKNKMTNLSLCKINVFNITSGCLILIYFVFRILLLTYLSYITAFYNILSYFEMALTLLNYYWFYKILKMSKII